MYCHKVGDGHVIDMVGQQDVFGCLDCHQFGAILASFYVLRKFLDALMQALCLQRVLNGLLGSLSFALGLTIVRQY